MRVFINPNVTKKEALPVAAKACEVLKKAGADIIIENNCHGIDETACGAVRMPLDDAFKNCDITVSVGGDGSMLHAARHAIKYQKPLLGVNTGRLGFLTSVEQGELEKLARLPRGEYSVENRSTLQADIKGFNRDDAVALNDIVLFKEQPEKAISLSIYCDDILVSKFRGDGVIFSTATGSTAYSMSAGGPIMDAHLDGIIVTHICAHIVQTPPLVLSSRRVVRVVSTGTDEEHACICCDGRNLHRMVPGEEVQICLSDKKVPLVQFHDTGQLKSIDTKLRGR